MPADDDRGIDARLLRAELGKQLDRIYTRVENDNNRRVQIRNWCVTTWIGTLTIIATGKTPGVANVFVLPIIAILLFWLLDAFHSTFILLNGRRAGKLEKALLLSVFDQSIARTSMLESGFEDITFRDKLYTFLRAAFLCETVFFLYFLLLIATGVLRFMVF